MELGRQENPAFSLVEPDEYWRNLENNIWEIQMYMSVHLQRFDKRLSKMKQDHQRPSCGYKYKESAKS